MPVRVVVHAGQECRKCDGYRALLNESGAAYEWQAGHATQDEQSAENTHPTSATSGTSAVSATADAAAPDKLTTITFAPEHGDVFELVNPETDELQRWLERFGLRERTIHHQANGDGSGRYILPLAGEDAFITYVDRDGIRHIDYSQVPADRRGQGLGAELSHKTLDALIAEGRQATFGCGYVAAVASRYPKWQDYVSPS